MSTPTTTPAISEARIQELIELFGDPSEVSDLFTQFFAELPERMETLRKSVASSSAPGIERTAHALSGSSGSLGAMRVQRAAKTMEESSRKGDLDDCAAQLAILESELENLRSFLNGKGLL